MEKNFKTATTVATESKQVENNLFLRLEDSSYTDDSNVLHPTTVMYVDVPIGDGATLPIKMKPKTTTLVKLLKAKNQLSGILLKCDGVQQFVDSTKDKPIKFYEFYVVVSVSNVPRKWVLKIAQGAPLANKRIDVSIERGIILNAMGIPDEVGNAYAEEEITDPWVKGGEI